VRGSSSASPSTDIPNQYGTSHDNVVRDVTLPRSTFMIPPSTDTDCSSVQISVPPLATSYILNVILYVPSATAFPAPSFNTPW